MACVANQNYFDDKDFADQVLEIKVSVIIFFGKMAHLFTFHIFQFSINCHGFLYFYLFVKYHLTQHFLSNNCSFCTSTKCVKSF